MRGTIVIAGVMSLFVAAAIARGQATEEAPAFEVASVKRVLNGMTVPGGGYQSEISGGPGTRDPGQIHYVNVALETLLLNAYGITRFQLSGPAWLETELYEITAKIPPGATKAQFNIMLQNLLKERFNITLHQETRELAVYELTVSKEGPKLQNAAAPDPDQAPPGQLGRDKDGYINFPPGHPNFFGIAKGGSIRFSARMQTTADIAGKLANIVGRPILDKTGMTGVYDFKLGFSLVGLPGAPASNADLGEDDLFKSIQIQLGLKLESRKDPVDCLVIDHADKLPTEN